MKESNINSRNEEYLITKRGKEILTCDATVKFRERPLAFKLIRNIIQSISLVNLVIAESLAVIVMDTSNWPQLIPDCQKHTRFFFALTTDWHNKGRCEGNNEDMSYLL